MAGCKRWISNGLSNIELWDIAFSRHMLSKSQVTELLRDDSNFVEQALTKPAVQKLLDDPEFLGIISREAHRFLLEAVCQFRMPLPSLFFDRFESVLNALQVDQPQIAGWSEALKKMLTRGKHNCFKSACFLLSDGGYSIQHCKIKARQRGVPF